MSRFRYRNVHTVNRQRLLLALMLFALLPVVVEIPALVAVLLVTLFWAMISYEAIRFAEGRERVRHQLAAEPPSP